MILTYMLLIAVFIILLRIIIGPTFADRVIALDAFVNLIILFMVIYSIYLKTTLYLDIAIVLAMLSFVGTLAIAKYVVITK